MGNGLNCQNCHLEAGIKPFANNFLDVAGTYPKFRARSGEIESVNHRIRDCYQRSLTANALDSNTKEMKALAAYILWTGKNISKDNHPDGVGSMEIPFINRAADSARGIVVYNTRCTVCHGANGEGKVSSDSVTYLYPPVCGEHSYAVSAGMYRITKLASFLRNNMPQGASYKHPQLINEEAWDVAAFINSQPHPKIIFASDWPSTSTKPVDYPFEPYTDGYTETEHKYGPFQPIVDKRKAMGQ